jgi:glycosyltransferase involved in cell wall biosynthesis
MEAGANAAFVYARANFDTGGSVLAGRQAASRGFLDSFVRHGGAEKFYCYAAFQEDFDDFSNRIVDAIGGPRVTVWVRPTALADASEVGTLFRPGPDIGELAWLRRRFDRAGFSLCGVTHATADGFGMDALGGLLTAPVEPWDALVATSEAVKAMVERLLDGWGAYLGRRFGAPGQGAGGRPRTAARIAVIPLGVDCDAFAAPADAPQARKELRQRLGIGDDEVAVLYLGRLSHTDKANPLALYLSLEAAARASGRKVHLIQAGWFPGSFHEKVFRDGAQAFAPSVGHAVLDGRDPQIQRWVRFAADVFASLPDNVQESFGLAPVEAMAAGLPLVVSDWNGYRETVRDGIDGFRVPTLMPPAGAGEDLAYWFAGGIADSESYLASAAQSVAVDVAQATEAFSRLLADGELRRRMGEAGRARARAEFDWRVVVARYQELWGELRRVRAAARPPAPPADEPDFHPLRADPYRLFRSYPTRVIEDSLALERAPEAEADRIGRMRASALAMLLPNLLLNEEETAVLLGPLDRGPAPAGDLVAALPAKRAQTARRTLGWLLKIGALRARV